MSLLEARNVKVYFESATGFLGSQKHVVKAVDDVSFSVKAGTTVGLVGESGSGKSTLGRAITRLAPLSGGEVFFEGAKISDLDERSFFPYRKQIQMIFQDPYNSLDPRMTVEAIIAEPLQIHFPEMSREERRAKIGSFLDKVGLSADFLNRYPHQFSGGQRQRINIARSLILEPRFVICDESVSALDVSVQAQIVNLLQDLQKEMNLTYLFIAHDLAIVEHISDEVLVMNRGKLVEHASADNIYANPQDPYTQKLIDAVPKMPTLSGLK
ncbi:MAG: ABC transporter ATP-binding protein [Opitutales bacterium]